MGIPEEIATRKEKEAYRHDVGVYESGVRLGWAIALVLCMLIFVLINWNKL